MPGTTLNQRKREKRAICLQGAHSLTQIIIIDNTVRRVHQGDAGATMGKGGKGMGTVSLRQGHLAALKDILVRQLLAIL